MRAKGDKKGALELLDEARSLIGGRARNLQQMQAQITLAQAYAQNESATGFEIIEPLIDQLNELTAASAVVEEFMNNYGAVRDGEISLQVNYSPVFSMYNQCMAAAGARALTSGERSRSPNRFNAPNCDCLRG